MKKELSIRALLRGGWQLTMSNIGAIVLLFIMTMVFYVVLIILEIALPATAAPLKFIVQQVLSLWLGTGYLLVLVMGLKTRQLEPSLLFKGGRYMLRYIGIYLIIGFLIFASMVPVALAMGVYGYVAGPPMAELQALAELLPKEQGSAMSEEARVEFISKGQALFQQYAGFLIGELLLLGVGIIPLMVIMCRLYYAGMVMVDKDAGVIESLEAAWRITRGATVKLLVLLTLVMPLLYFVGLLFFFVGIFIAAPVSIFAWGIAYVVLLRQTEAAEGIVLRPGHLSPRQEDIA